MMVTQPGNIIIYDYKSEVQIVNAVLEREQKISTDQRIDERKKKEFDKKNRNGIITFVIICGIYMFQLQFIFY